MPPFIPKKRNATTPPPVEKATPVKKPKLNNTAQAKPKSLPKRQASKQPVYTVSDDSDSSLSSIDSAEFESVALAKNTRPKPAKKPVEIDDDSDGSDEVEWENAIHHQHEPYVPKEPAKVSGDVQFTLDADDGDVGAFASALGRKQGISKAEKAARIAAHQLHVQFLLWHNHLRNRWISDPTVQKTLMDQLPAQIKGEVEKWKRASGLVNQPTTEKSKTKKEKKRKGKKDKPINERDERDWGRPSQRLEEGKADLSSGDPLISLLKVLSAYWKKRFAVTAPGLRKRGYSSRAERKKEIFSYKNDPHDPEKHGERISNIKEFRELAKKCEGSRDVGAQLFTALLRGLGIECRMVASLQPAGFGATRAEEMIPKKAQAKQPVQQPSTTTSDDDDDDVSLADIDTINNAKTKGKGELKQPRKARQSNGKGIKKGDSDSDNDDLSDDDSVVDVTPVLPKKRPALYDREVPFPIYWTEAISPITNKIFPVSPLVLERPVATNDEILASFEPRGAKADKVKLVFAYVIGYSSDGTAKDVTVRYLRKHIWPGKTKGFRYPIEKVPVYDRTGRIKRYEDYDWFKHIMGGYRRSDTMRTAVDDVEDATDLVPQLPEKKQIDDSIDTLTSLKASEDFVLERFLRREEALKPGAEPDRMFVSGKGDTLKGEPVYRRADVERCLTTESWHKEGRIPKLGEVPLKRVPVRAVTITRKREAEEHERLTGEKQLQGLYSWDQTEYIIPPPIENGIIPKNSFGNIDAFVPSMVPKGAAHIPLKGTLRICKKLEIDFAEAVVGFEFGNKRAIPVIKGVVVAKENEKKVREEWKKWSEEQKRKEEMKVEKLVLEMWRKFIIGMKIRKRVQAQYGDDVEMGGGAVAELPEKIMSGLTRAEAIDVDEEDEEGEPSGFMTEAASENTGLEDSGAGGGFFLPHSDEEMSAAEDLVMEHNDDAESEAAPLRRRRIVAIPEAANPSPTASPNPHSGPVSKAATQKRKSLLQQQAELNRPPSISDTPPTPPTDDTKPAQRSKPRRPVLSDSESSPASSDASSPSSPSSSSPDASDSEGYNPMSKRPARTTKQAPGATRRASGWRTRSDNMGDMNGNDTPPQLLGSTRKKATEMSTPIGKAKKGAVTSPYFNSNDGSATKSKRESVRGSARRGRRDV